MIVGFGRQLFRNRHVDTRTFAALVDRLGRQRTFDAITRQELDPRGRAIFDRVVGADRAPRRRAAPSA